jgi:hypothetical protein
MHKNANLIFNSLFMNEALMMTGQLLADPSFAHSMEVAQNVSK